MSQRNSELLTALTAACGPKNVTAAAEVRTYCEQLKDEGVLCKETHENVIRFAPPLVITEEELDWAFERIKKVLENN